MDRVSRREFLIAGAAAGGGLLLGWHMGGGPRLAAAATAAPALEFAPNAFIRVGTDGGVTLIMGQVEMGQGMYTSMPMLLAEELEVGLDQVRLEHAPPDDKRYVNPLFGFQATGGSTSVKGLYLPMRRAGATARTMLIAAAAERWNVEPASCRAERGSVIHAASGRRLGYGALAAAAAELPIPHNVPLKRPEEFKLIGTPAKRLDTPQKVNGMAQYGIDVRVPGMKIATVAASPVLGGKVAGLDEAKAMAIKGVHQVVRLDEAIAVVADHMWAAKQGLAALAIRWDDGPNAAVSTDDVVKGLAAAAETPGVVARKEGDAAAGIASAATKLEAVYQAPFLAHATLEPMNCTVHVRPDRLEVDYVTQAVRIAKQVDGPVKVIWTREEDVQHDVYRPYYYDRLAAGLDARGQPIAWSHRVVGPSILARWAPPAFRNGLDGDALDGAATLLYDIPAIQVEYVRHEEEVVNTGFWRGVGVTHNTFVIESFIDELAAAAKADPFEYRRALLTKAPRARAVLELAAKEAGWGTTLPAGRGRGVALMYGGFWGTYVAQVAELSVTPSGEVHVHRVVCAVDCGTVVNPDIVKAQIEGGVIFGIGGALWGEVTLKNGQVEQSNFHNVRVLRMNETPTIDVHLVRNFEAPGGMGEPGTAVTAPALANAVFAATGKRIRKLPLKADQLRSA